MVFTLCENHDSALSKTFKAVVADLNGFYGFDWRHGLPRVFIMPDRKTIDALSEKKTERWVIGFNDGRYVFLLDNKSMEKESQHSKRSQQEYTALLKHEMSHAFFDKLANGCHIPRWLNEGVAIYISGQLQTKGRPEKLMTCLGYFRTGGKGIYGEAGFAVKALVEVYGRKKLLRLIKNLHPEITRGAFEKLFKKIYGFAPTYKNLNQAYARIEK
jgi:hypothetical protein